MEREEDFVPTKDEIEQALGGGVTAAEPEELADLTQEEKTIGAKIMPKLVAQINARVQAESAKKLSDQVRELNGQNQRMMADEVKKLRDSIVPPDPKQIETLLTQEYGEMEVQIAQRSGEKKVFKIRELPQEAEKKLFDTVSKRIVPHLKELAAVEWTATATQADKLQKVLAIIPDGLDTLAECCAICLNPYGDDAIDKVWVQKNMGSARQMAVVNAQMEVSKLRDFFSGLSQLLPK